MIQEVDLFKKLDSHSDLHNTYNLDLTYLDIEDLKK
jgi:hypothetical protein